MKIKIPKIRIGTLKFKVIKDKEFKLPAIYQATCFPAMEHRLLFDKKQLINLEEKIVDNPDCFLIIGRPYKKPDITISYQTLIKFGIRDYRLKIISRGELGFQPAIYQYKRGLLYHYDLSKFIRTELLSHVTESGDIILLTKKL